MWKPRWWLAFPLALTVLISLGTSRAGAGTVHDKAGMFSKEAVAKANAELGRIERDLQLNVNIETIPSLEGEDIRDVTERHARRSGESGLFVLMAKDDSKLRVLASKDYRRALEPREPAIRKAFTGEFSKKDFDAGLLKGVETIASEASSAHAELGSLRQAGAPGRVNPRNAGPPFRGMPARRGGGFGIGALLGIGLLIFGVLFIFRMLGALFGGNRGQYGYGPQGRMGPGYGGPGYGGGGGGGGGFMSGLLGGLGGAVAGNWLYDQFSGRHHGGNYADTTGSVDAGDAPDAGGGDNWSGGGGSTGDWGGGDAGGGGDWGGGGGGDWGGGGGGGGDW